LVCVIGVGVTLVSCGGTSQRGPSRPPASPNSQSPEIDVPTPAPTETPTPFPTATPVKPPPVACPDDSDEPIPPGALTPDDSKVAVVHTSLGKGFGQIWFGPSSNATEIFAQSYAETAFQFLSVELHNWGVTGSVDAPRVDDPIIIDGYELKGIAEEKIVNSDKTAVAQHQFIPNSIAKHTFIPKTGEEYVVYTSIAPGYNNKECWESGPGHDLCQSKVRENGN